MPPIVKMSGSAFPELPPDPVDVELVDMFPDELADVEPPMPPVPRGASFPQPDPYGSSRAKSPSHGVRLRTLVMIRYDNSFDGLVQVVREKL